MLISKQNISSPSLKNANFSQTNNVAYFNKGNIDDSFSFKGHNVFMQERLKNEVSLVLNQDVSAILTKYNDVLGANFIKFSVNFQKFLKSKGLEIDYCKSSFVLRSWFKPINDAVAVVLTNTKNNTKSKPYSADVTKNMALMAFYLNIAKNLPKELKESGDKIIKALSEFDDRFMSRILSVKNPAALSEDAIILYKAATEKLLP